ncbi:MAG TPA: sugar MFS transporter [Polyangiaceae bacterium]|jgi:FHS family L-fucose permease-like MFS transporter
MITPLPAANAASDMRSRRLASGVLIGLFFVIGFLTCLDDIVIPHFKSVFALDYTRATLVQFSFFAAYFVISPPSGMVIRRWGYKRAIVVGLATAASGCIGFYPAAATRSYPLFLGSLFVLASGFTLLQVAANPYVAVLGPPETASSRLTLTQAFNSVGTTIAPVVGSLLILPPTDLGATASDAARVDATRSVQLPYLAFAAVLVAMTVALSLMKLPEVRPQTADRRSSSAWSHSPLVFGTIALFLYVGAEVSIGSFLVSFLQDPSVVGIDARSAARGLSFYWGGAMIGRFLGAGALRRWSPRHVLAVAGGVALLLVASTVALSGWPAMVTLLSVGLFNSIMFPTIFTLAIEGLGDRTGQGSGILCMAIVGGAILPVVQGAVADRVGVHLAFLVPMASYGYIAWYGLAGAVPRVRQATPTPKEAGVARAMHS